MSRRAKGSTGGTNGSASRSRDESDWSDSTLRDDDAWNGDRASGEGEPAQEVQEFQENGQFQADQVYGNTQPSQEHTWSEIDHRRYSATSSPYPMERFLGDYQRQEHFWIGAETTGNGGSEGLDQSVVLPELDHNNNHKISGSGTVMKSHECPIEGPSSRESKELNNARSVGEPNPLKRRHDEHKTRKAGKK